MAAQRYLILLDMNGTICYRLEEPVPGVPADLYVRHKHYYARGGAHAFVKALAGSGAYDVCVYSSMMEHNVRAGLDAIFPHEVGRAIAHVLDRRMTKPDPRGENEWDTVRDMSKVWAAHRGYGPERTILLDNEARKFQDTPRNGIVVPEFGAAEVRARKADTLKALQAYLLALARAAPTDVRAYLAANPLGAAAPARAKARAPDKGEDALFARMQALSLTAPTPRVAAATAPAPCNAAPTAATVPRGTALHLVCVEGGRFVMSNPQAGISVRGPVRDAVRLQPKMDFHLLESLVGAAELRVEIDEPKLKAWRKRAVAVPAAVPHAAVVGAAMLRIARERDGTR